MGNCCGGEGLGVRGAVVVLSIVPDELIMPVPLQYAPPDLPESRLLQDGKEGGGAVGREEAPVRFIT